MKKKFLFMMSLFAVAMFSVAVAQGPADGKCPKAKTECCQAGDKACADCPCTTECKEAECADCKGCDRKADCKGKKECTKTAKADCKKGDKPCCAKK